MDDKKQRYIYEIAEDIYKCWRKVHYAAKPYLDAMLCLRTLDDKYGLEYADMVVLYFLNNATSWRGDDARRIKAELNGMIKAWNKARGR